jgi:exocyst complex component 3
MSTQVSNQTATQTIAEYFQSPDDLLKIPSFRKKLAKEKASIDAKLKSGVKDQLDATREGLKRLLGTRNNVQAIKDEMAAVDRTCTDPNNQIKTFDQISRVSLLCS